MEIGTGIVSEAVANAREWSTAHRHSNRQYDRRDNSSREKLDYEPGRPFEQIYEARDIGGVVTAADIPSCTAHVHSESEHSPRGQWFFMNDFTVSVSDDQSLVRRQIARFLHKENELSGAGDV